MKRERSQKFPFILFEFWYLRLNYKQTVIAKQFGEQDEFDEQDGVAPAIKLFHRRRFESFKWKENIKAFLI